MQRLRAEEQLAELSARRPVAEDGRIRGRISLDRGGGLVRGTKWKWRFSGLLMLSLDCRSRLLV